MRRITIVAGLLLPAVAWAAPDVIAERSKPAKKARGLRFAWQERLSSMEDAQRLIGGFPASVPSGTANPQPDLPPEIGDPNTPSTGPEGTATAPDAPPASPNPAQPPAQDSAPSPSPTDRRAPDPSSAPARNPVSPPPSPEPPSPAPAPEPLPPPSPPESPSPAPSSSPSSSTPPTPDDEYIEKALDDPRNDPKYKDTDRDGKPNWADTDSPHYIGCY